MLVDIQVKFINIGTGNMIITTVDSTLIGVDIDNSDQMTLYPGDNVEIITYNDNGVCLFISVGKKFKINTYSVNYHNYNDYNDHYNIQKRKL